MAEDINLIRPTSPLSERFGGLEKRLRSGSIAAAAILLVLGVIVGASYTALSLQMRRLHDQKTQLLTRIASESEKEALLVAVQSRAVVVEKVRAQTTPLGSTLELAQEIAQGGFITDANMAEQGRFAMVVHVASLDDAVLLVRRIGTLVDEGRIKSPILESFQLDDEGEVQLNISFFVVFL